MNYKTTYCEKCNREYKNCNFNKHKCDRDIKYRILEEWKLDDDKYQCPKCNCSFSKMGLVGHYYRKHDDRGIKDLTTGKFSEIEKLPKVIMNA